MLTVLYPEHFKGQFDRIICDPPFLSVDCQTKGRHLLLNTLPTDAATSCRNSRYEVKLTTFAAAALTVRWLSRRATALTAGLDNSKRLRIITCTGAQVGEILLRLYKGDKVCRTTFRPRHSKGLSNEFCCYANFKTAAWELE